MDPSSTTSPADVIADMPVKRPPEDEEPFDLSRAPPKRQAVEAFVAGGQASLSRASSETTEAHLSDKSPEELVSIIHEMQASHARQVAELRDQYAVVSRQLDQLRSLTNTHLASQINAIQSVQRNIASISTPQPAVRTLVSNTGTIPVKRLSITAHRSFSPQNQAATPALVTGLNSAPTHNSAFAIPQREPPGSPSASTTASATTGSITPGTASHGKVELTITPSPTPNEPPTVEQSSLDTVQEVWEEYRYGRNGNPPVESLDALWGPRWRPDAKIRVWYGRRKAILDKIRQYMADGIDEKSAVMEVEKMRRGRTLHWLSRILLEDRKATRKQWKAAQRAATAAKQAMHALPPGGSI